MVDDGAIISPLCLIMEVSNTGDWIMRLNHFAAETLPVSGKKIETGGWLNVRLLVLVPLAGSVTRWERAPGI